ncbi:MAG: hypothetical protein ACYTFH_07025 [Planctomycetota bacterium]
MSQTMIGRNSPLDRLNRRRGLARPGGRAASGGSTARAEVRLTAEEERLVKHILEEPMDYRSGSTTRRRRSRSPTFRGTDR